jgi:hypothetical protein
VQESAPQAAVRRIVRSAAAQHEQPEEERRVADGAADCLLQQHLGGRLERGNGMLQHVADRHGRSPHLAVRFRRRLLCYQPSCT